MYKETCTLYSKYTDVVTKNNFYTKTTLNNVQWQNSKGRNIYKSGAMSIDALTVYIKPAATDKIYVDIIQFLQLSCEEKLNYWTMQAGDILVKGDVDYKYSSDENILAALKKLYSEVFTITSVDAWFMGNPHLNHWEVWGK